MEPFGLFQLLQSLLSAPINPAPTPSEPPPAQEAETNAPTPVKTEQTYSQDAFLQFMQAHDTRAKRTKK